MRRLLTFMLNLLWPMAALAADVGVSISVGQPGFYGRIDIGTLVPRLVYAEPLIIAPPPGPPPGPIYLHVPPGHARHWRDHCHEYGAVTNTGRAAVASISCNGTGTTTSTCRITVLTPNGTATAGESPRRTTLATTPTTITTAMIATDDRDVDTRSNVGCRHAG